MKNALIIFLFLLSPIIASSENCQGETVNGQRSGRWKCFYDDNTIQQEGDYVNGLKEGLWKFYHANGKLALEGTFVKDAEKGKWLVYSETGEKIDEIDYGQ